MDFKHYLKLKKNLFQHDGSSLIQRYKDIEYEKLNPLILAYVGDAYFHLFVRSRLLRYELSHVRLLNDVSMLFVSATWQAKAYSRVKEFLTEEENILFKRAKNTKSHAPRAATIKDYHISTGLEAVLGLSYLKDDKERLDFLCNELFNVMADMYIKENI